MKIVINAKIKTIGPLSIKMPKPEGSRENEFENFPVMTRGIDDDGNKLRTGYLPATTLRGFLRRAVTLRSMKAAAERGAPYKLPQIYSEMIGQDAESEKQAGDIDLLAKESPDFKAFVKAFRKEYSDGGSIKELEAWLKTVYDAAVK